MKNFLITVATVLSAVSATYAEGYQVNTISARQQGMGSTGVALKLGAESQLFNPGAVAMSESPFEISGAFTAISSHVSAIHNGVEYKTNNDISTPLNVATSFKIYDNLYAGVMFYTPYGSGIKWGTHWPGAVLNQDVSIKVFSLQPTFSYRVLPNLSIGAGLTINWGSVDLNKALVNGASMNKLMGAMGMPTEAMYSPDASPASVNIAGNSKIALGFNVGAMWEVNDKITIGASYRSKFKLTVEKGDAQVSYTGAAESMLTPVLDNLNSTNFKASLPCPYVLTVGIAYKPIDRLTLAFDAQLNGWKTYKNLDIEFEGLEAFNQHLVKNYKNTMTYHIGAEFEMTKRLDLRAGIMIDTNPCDKNNYNPETPGQTRLCPSLGLSFTPAKHFTIDLAFTYVHGCGTEGATGHYDDFGYKMAYQINPELPAMLGFTPSNSFTADYKVHAFIPAIGLRYAF